MASYSNEPPLGSPVATGTARPKMEPRARRAKLRATGFMLVALLAGLAAAWLIVKTLAKQRQPGVVPMTRLAVAAVDLPLATTLSAELVAFVEWPTQVLPEGHHADAESLVGRVTSKDVAKGEPLLESRLADKSAGLGMAAVIPPTHRAMTVLVNEVIGVAGFIHPNDLVDVITTMQATPGSQEVRSRIVLQNVRVMAVGQEMVTKDAKPVRVPVVTLLVTPAESERLALASTQGKVQLTLRSRADEEVVTTAGVSSPDLFGRAAPAPVAAKPEPAPRQKAKPAKAAPAVQVAQKPEAEVVEVLRGDRFEERKLRGKETP